MLFSFWVFVPLETGFSYQRKKNKRAKLENSKELTLHNFVSITKRLLQVN